MMFSMFLLLALAVFITQLMFCFYAKKLWIRLLPLCLAAAGSLLCWGMYFLGTFSRVYGGDFAAFVYGVVLLLVSLIAGLAWGIFGIVKLVQMKGK